jgi:hypothetical protein
VVTTSTCIGRTGRHILESQIVRTHPDRIVMRIVPAEGHRPSKMAPMVADSRD